MFSIERFFSPSHLNLPFLPSLFYLKNELVIITIIGRWDACQGICMEGRGKFCGVSYSCHLCVGSWDQIQATGLLWQAPTKMSHLSGPFICVSVTHFHPLLQMNTAPTVKPLDSFPCRFFLFSFQRVTASCFRSEPILEFHSPKHSLFLKKNKNKNHRGPGV